MKTRGFPRFFMHKSIDTIPLAVSTDGEKMID